MLMLVSMKILSLIERLAVRLMPDRPALDWSWPAPKPALMRVRVIDGEGYLIGRRLFMPELPEGFESVDRCEVPGNPRPVAGFEWVRVSAVWMARNRHSPRPSMALRCSGDLTEGWWSK
jgi:hypothetical protein